MKRITAVILSVLLLAGLLAGCSIPTPGFADYNVSGYIKALLDSSYLGDNDDYISFTRYSAQEAAENNQLTIENGAIHFCNTFNILPSDEQLAELEEIMGAAFKLTSYNVKEKQENATGYFVEVEIKPLTVFKELTSEIDTLRVKAQAGELGGKPVSSSSSEESSNYNEYDDSYGWGDDTESSDGYDTESSAPSEEDEEDAGELFVDEVIKLCRNALGNPTYGDAIIITLDILKDDEGNLSLDTTQIETIDETVITFERKTSTTGN